MNIKQLTIDWITRMLKIPSAAMRMFKAANDISGLNKNTLPAELIPLNSIQLSRGLLNFTFIQSKPDWILPCWAVKQYDPLSPSFIPRSHMGVSMNVTNRNWAGTGTPECNIEPIVDPAGLITLFRDGWSVDIWLRVNNEIYFPSYNEVTQQLVNNLPIVQTTFVFKGIKTVSTVFTAGSTLSINTETLNVSGESINCEIIFAIRPFNPEGISLIDEIRFLKEEKSILVNNSTRLAFSQAPSLFIGSTYTEGDVAASIKNNSLHENNLTKCSSGMATAAAIFNVVIPAGEKIEINSYAPLETGNNIKSRSLQDHLKYWDSLFGTGMQIKTPDAYINNLFKASAATLLMLTDKEEIMPGPFTYHQFWFRDAAYMINALDKLGFSSYAEQVINSFKDHIDKDGYFRSQKGEWDSNGQALWTIYQHYLLTGDRNTILNNFSNCYRGVVWINNKRKNNRYAGILPAGLSAEHLGLADYYYWDNFWSLAGIDSFISMCSILDKKAEKEFAEKLYQDYLTAVTEYIKTSPGNNSLNIITAGPARDADYGMIGSICAIYPLMLQFDKELTLNTLNFISDHYFIDDLFYQNFIHSGLNIYLSLQAAHSYLLLGERKKFLKIMRRVTRAASPVMNFPEAIHPVTGGGVMGDGHHGWAAAEYVLAVRDAFLSETANRDGTSEITFFAGIPPEWFTEDNEISVLNAPSSAGRINAGITVSGRKLEIKINCSAAVEKQLWKIILPVKCTPAFAAEHYTCTFNRKNETVITIKPGRVELSLITGETVTQKTSGALN